MGWGILLLGFKNGCAGSGVEMGIWSGWVGNNGIGWTKVNCGCKWGWGRVVMDNIDIGIEDSEENIKDMVEHL